LTVRTKLCERILFERPLRDDIIATDASHHLLLSCTPQQLEFRPFEHHMLATLRGIGFAQLDGKLTHGANKLLPFCK
jgi:hypothetical protein